MLAIKSRAIYIQLIQKDRPLWKNGLKVGS